MWFWCGQQWNFSYPNFLLIQILRFLELAKVVRKIEVGPYYVWLDVLEERLLNFWHTCTSMTIISSGPITHLSFLLNSHTGSRQAIIYLLHHLNLSIMVTSPKGAKLKGIYLIIEAGLNFHTPYTAITITVHVHV